MFFFNQKTAYEMRISDWSSDVCSSDLALQKRGVDLKSGFWSSDAATVFAPPSSLLTRKDRQDAGDERKEFGHVVAQEGLGRLDRHFALVGDHAGRELDIGLGRVHLGWSSDERRVGKECVSTVRYRGSPYL